MVQLKLLLRNTRKPCEVADVKTDKRYENSVIFKNKIAPRDELKNPTSHGLNICRVITSKEKHTGTDITQNKKDCVRHRGMFCCVACGRKWVSHSLFCQDAVNLDGLKMQCFNCNNSVLPQRVEKLNSFAEENINSKGYVLNKIFKKNFENGTPRYIMETRSCFQCGRQGHLARSCAATVPHQGVLNGQADNHCLYRYRGYPGGLTGRLN